MCQLTVRLQGFIDSLNLKPLGNWNGHDHDAPRAIQFINLSSGGFMPPFTAQKEAMANLRAMISESVGGDTEHDSLEGSNIVLKRRVFTRVRPTHTPSSALRVGDDPTGKAARIASRWIVDHRISAAIQHVDGRIVPATHMAFHKGDFVDVAVFAEVVTRRTGRTTNVDVNFAVQSVVRLTSVSELKANVKAVMEQAARQTGSTSTEEGPSGFNYDTDFPMQTEAVPPMDILYEDAEDDDDYDVSFDEM
ncbi:hypothetical protein A0H81_02175 [Grifola frondosa]|uniref:Uncharacterized protein n=1 Tax=Grifola frondosa TaxID=5627 RepID=A0A1C7MMB4_GRIFR|nr:hypothetical protein A0H81_02175 [Grifola frondosa]